MNFGKMLSLISPAYGMATGHGLGKIMPYLSPGLGMLSGQGPFGQHGGGDEQEQGQMPMAGGVAPGPMPQGQPQAGMFGGGGESDLMAQLRQRMMMGQFGGGY